MHMKINGNSLPANASQWKMIPKESSVLVDTIMDGRLPFLKGAGFGTRTIEIDLMIKEMNDRDAIELSISRILSMLTGTVEIELDANEYASFFYGCLKSYDVKPIVKKRAQILLLTRTGVLYEKHSYSNLQEVQTSSGASAFQNTDYVEYPSSFDYRPCIFWAATKLPRMRVGTMDFSGLFYDPVRGIDLGAPINMTAGGYDGRYVDGLTGDTGRTSWHIESGGEACVVFEKASVEPLNSFGTIPTYPLINPGAELRTERIYFDYDRKDAVYVGLTIFDIRR